MRVTLGQTAEKAFRGRGSPLWEEGGAAPAKAEQWPWSEVGTDAMRTGGTREDGGWQVDIAGFSLGQVSKDF